MSLRDASLDGIDCNMTDFWEWAYGDVHQHSVRSVLSEFIVHRALGLHSQTKTRIPFDRVDLRWEDPRWGTGSIEIKSASGVVSWADGPKRAANPTNPVFNIAPTRVGEQAALARVADVFLFCVWPHTDPARLPLDAAGWQFFGVPTHVLDGRGQHKTISLNVVKHLAGEPCALDGLKPYVAGLLLTQRKATASPS